MIRVLKPWILFLNLLTNFSMYPKFAFLKSQALIAAFIIVVAKHLTTGKATL